VLVGLELCLRARVVISWVHGAIALEKSKASGEQDENHVPDKG
jgi:hypothetical protein